MAENNRAMSLENTKQYLKGILQGWITNKSTLDKLSESQSGELLYNGNSVGGGPGGGASITIDDELSSTSENPVQNKVIYAALQNAGSVPMTIDSSLSDTSENPVQNKVVKAALDDKADVSDIPDVSGFALASDIPDVSGFALVSDIPDVSGFATTSDLNAKQDILTFDDVPTINSNNPVKSGGVYAALQNVSGGGGTGTIPIASSSILGGIKVGAGLGIDSSGILYVVGAPKNDGYIELSNDVAELDPQTKMASVRIIRASGNISITSNNPNVSATLNGDNIIIQGTSVNDVAIIHIVSAENGIYTESYTNLCVGLALVSWADGNDVQIKAMIDSHYSGRINIYDYWNVGDERIVSLSEIPSGVTGETQPAQDIIMRIVNSGGRKLEDGTTDCAFIVESSVLSTAGYLHPSSLSSVDWSNCTRRTWCNTSFRDALPQAFKDCFKPFINEYGVAYGSSGKYTSYTKTGEVVDYFSIASICEIQITSATGPTSDNDQKWQYYKQNQSARIKRPMDSTSDVQYYARDKHNNNTIYFVSCAGTSGHLNGTSMIASLYIAPFGVI